MYVCMYINQCLKIVNIVLNAIESRARLGNKNGKSYIYTIKSYSEFHVYMIIRLYVGECLYRAFIKYLDMVIVVIIYCLLHEGASCDIPEIVFNVLF